MKRNQGMATEPPKTVKLGGKRLANKKKLNKFFFLIFIEFNFLRMLLRRYSENLAYDET